jgi:hypothetical protein
MNFSDFLQALRRRWYLVAGGLLVTAALCVGALLIVGPSYERRASELLVPGTQSIPVGGNPFLYLGGLTQASDVLAGALASDEVLDPIEKANPGVTIEVARDVSTSGPVIVIAVTGDSDKNVGGAFTRMLDTVPRTLAMLQSEAGISAAARMTALPITVDSQSTVSHKNRIELAVIVGVVGIALSLLLQGLVDALAVARRERKAARSEAPAARSLTVASDVPELSYDERLALARMDDELSRNDGAEVPLPSEES